MRFPQVNEEYRTFEYAQEESTSKQSREIRNNTYGRNIANVQS